MGLKHSLREKVAIFTLGILAIPFFAALFAGTALLICAFSGTSSAVFVDGAGVVGMLAGCIGLVCSAVTATMDV